MIRNLATSLPRGTDEGMGYKSRAIPRYNRCNCRIDYRGVAAAHLSLLLVRLYPSFRIYLRGSLLHRSGVWLDEGTYVTLHASLGVEVWGRGHFFGVLDAHHCPTPGLPLFPLPRIFGWTIPPAILDSRGLGTVLDDALYSTETQLRRGKVTCLSVVVWPVRRTCTLLATSKRVQGRQTMLYI